LPAFQLFAFERPAPAEKHDTIDPFHEIQKLKADTKGPGLNILISEFQRYSICFETRPGCRAPRPALGNSQLLDLSAYACNRSSAFQLLNVSALLSWRIKGDTLGA
jgi:hypothetical protein